MAKRLGNTIQSSGKKVKLDEQTDLWGDDPEPDQVDEWMNLATQQMSQDFGCAINARTSTQMFLPPPPTEKVNGGSDLFSSFEPMQNGWISTQKPAQSKDKELQEKLLTKEGEVSILRLQLKQAQSAIEEIKEEHLQHSEIERRKFNDQITSLTKEVNALKSEIEFKNFEITNLRMKTSVSSPDKKSSVQRSPERLVLYEIPIIACNFKDTLWERIQPHLQDEFKCENGDYNGLLSIVRTIGKNGNAQKHSVLLKTLSEELVINGVNIDILINIVKEIIFLQPDVCVLHNLVRFFRNLLRNHLGTFLCCGSVNAFKKDVKRGTWLYSVNSCIFQVFAALLEQYEHDNSDTLNIIQLVNIIISSDLPWTFSQSSSSCDCLCKLYTLTINVMYNCVHRNGKESCSNLLKYGVEPLRLLRIRNPLLIENCLPLLARYQHLVESVPSEAVMTWTDSVLRVWEASFRSFQL